MLGRVRIAVMFLLLLVLAVLPIQPGSAASGDAVTVISISGEIDSGQAALVKRGLQEAKSHDAKAVIIQINTLGGRVDSAISIRDQLLACPIPTIAFVKSRAWSAGALIALSCRHIVMSPGSSIGAAEPIPATEKNIAALKAEFSSTAVKTGHNPRIAEAMVDKTSGYPDYAETGQILALTDVQAKETAVSEGTAGELDDVLHLFSLDGAALTSEQTTWKDMTIALLQNQYVKMILVGLIIAAVMAEIKMAGIGVGAVTAILLGAVLMIPGDDTLEDSLKIGGAFVGGLVLIGMELAVPGIGIFGVAGVLLLFGSLFYMLGADTQAMIILAGGIVISVLLFALVIRRLPKSRLFSKVALTARSTGDKGYISHKDKSEYLHCMGRTITILRPAGTIRIGKERVDAVSNGGFIDRDVEVRVVQIDGSRIVVEPVDKT